MPNPGTTVTPLVSDFAITNSAESYADLEMTKNDGESYSTHLNGYEYGAKMTRSLYEADRAKQSEELTLLKEEMDRMRRALEEIAELNQTAGVLNPSMTMWATEQTALQALNPK